MDHERRDRFLSYFRGPPLNGDRQLLIQRTGYTKGRAAQLVDPEQPFGEKAAKNLALKLGLRGDAFERCDARSSTDQSAIKVEPKVNVADAVGRFLEAVATVPDAQRDELVQVLSLLARTGAPAYRQRLIQMLETQVQSPGSVSVLQPKSDQPMRQIRSPFGRREADKPKKASR